MIGICKLHLPWPNPIFVLKRLWPQSNNYFCFKIIAYRIVRTVSSYYHLPQDPEKTCIAFLISFTAWSFCILQFIKAVSLTVLLTLLIKQLSLRFLFP